MSKLLEKFASESAPLIIAEIAQNHDGSLGLAHAYIDALADTGADAVKFQTHIASAESTVDDQFRLKFSFQDKTRYDYWRRMEFSEQQWAELKAHADRRGIAFLSTPFSVEAVELLQRIGVEAWKIGSGDVMIGEIRDAIVATGKPLIVSSGMSGWDEIDSVIDQLRKTGTQFALLNCTSKYPTPLTEVGLNNLQEMKARYGCRVGLSDHSGSAVPSLAAIARGFPLIEVHATFDRRMFGPDVVASLTLQDIEMLVRFARDLAIIDAHPVSKDSIAGELSQQKKLFDRSLALRQDLPAGHVLDEADLTRKKPGNGIPWSGRQEMLGRTLRHDVSSDRLLRPEDVI